LGEKYEAPHRSHFLRFRLLEDEWSAIAESVEAHSLSDPQSPFSPGSLPALLKDADSLDRVRLHRPPDSAYFRHPFTAEYLNYAWSLLDKSEEALEALVATLSA
jgi:hypothetical protein